MQSNQTCTQHSSHWIEHSFFFIEGSHSNILRILKFHVFRWNDRILEMQFQKPNVWIWWKEMDSAPWCLFSVFHLLWNRDEKWQKALFSTWNCLLVIWIIGRFYTIVHAMKSTQTKQKPKPAMTKHRKSKRKVTYEWAIWLYTFIVFECECGFKGVSKRTERNKTTETPFQIYIK